MFLKSSFLQTHKVKPIIKLVFFFTLLTLQVSSYAAWPPDEKSDSGHDHETKNTKTPKISTQLTESAFKQAIKDLNNDNYETREKAHDQLLSASPEQQKELIELIKKTKIPETKARLNAISQALQDKVNAVNGLVLRTRLSQKTLHHGKTISIHATLRNISDKPLLLFIGTSHAGPVFSSGNAYKLTDINDKQLEAKLLNFPKCGMGLTPEYIIIMPGAAHTWTCPLRLEKADQQHSKILLGQYPNFQFSVTTGKTIKIEANFQNNIDKPILPKNNLVIDKVWTGKLTSKAMDLTVSGKAPND